MRKKTSFIPVSRRALFQRVDRALRKRGEHLLSHRGGRGPARSGDLYIVDLKQRRLVRDRCDLERLGKDLGVLRPFERLEDESEE